MEKQFNLITVIEAVHKRLKSIVIISLISLVSSFILTHPRLQIVPPVYEAVALFYPANLSLTDRPYLFDAQAAVDIEFDLFGTKQDVDRLVAIAKSTQVMKHLVEQFKLVDHYEINPEKTEFPLLAALSRLKKNYKSYKNEYGAIEIHVFDKDSHMAANLANEAVAMTDKIYRQMVLDGRRRLLKTLTQHADAKAEEVLELSRNMEQIADPAERRTLEIRYNAAVEQLVKYTKLVDQFELIAGEDISTIRIMESAIPPEKEEPYRWLIVIGVFFITLFVLIAGATVLHVLAE
ncbi:MAG: hypothetical protein KatS3mg031_2498 [Chitinophagales bacterium]|nr:MAG: hypothetical protein KatS3mg031_2498 [Chitinophagales bacterium]